jgi:hypothetical protein
MKRSPSPTLAALGLALLATPAAAQPALTIYNQDFAVVRERLPIELEAGENEVSFSGVTVHLEPDSVVLRDPEGRVELTVLEQNYRADTISQALLLSLYEGREIEFLVRDSEGREYPVRGKVVRSGYVPNYSAASRYGQQFLSRQSQLGGGLGAGQPIIEVDGKLRFSLPRQPVFPALTDDAILKPTLSWTLHAPRAARLEAELSYVTGGMSWQAAYNLVAPERGDTLDLVGWVTIDNQSGTAFERASLKLMAGDVSKLQQQQLGAAYARANVLASEIAAPQVTEKSFDEFHLYTLPRPTTLRNRETKQVEFARARGVRSTVFYVYDGAALGQQYQGWNAEMIRNNPDYGTQSNAKVWVMREFENSEDNGLGIALPRGLTRFYRRDDADGRLEFTGENLIDHTPKNETVRIYTGNAFDVVGERKRVDFQRDDRLRTMEEAFEIRLRNRKQERVEVRVAERLYRWVNWELVEQSHEHRRSDAQQIEFRVEVPPDGETVVTYRVRYSW